MALLCIDCVDGLDHVDVMRGFLLLFDEIDDLHDLGVVHDLTPFMRALVRLDGLDA